MRKLLLFLLLISVIGSAWAVWQQRGDAPPSVSLDTVSLGGVSNTISAPGRVNAVREVWVSAMHAGQVAGLPIADGQSVAKGDVLLQLAVADQQLALRRAEAVSAQRRAEVKRAEHELAAAEAGVAAGSRPRSELEPLRDALAISRAQRNVARQEVSQAKHQLEKRTVRAPMSGLLQQLSTAEGEWLAADKPFARIVDDQDLWVTARVHATDIADIHVGQGADIVSEVFPERQIHGTVRRLARSVDSSDDTNTIDVEIQLTAEAAGQLRFGEQVDVRITVAARDEVIVLPFGQIQDGDDGPSVWLYRAGQKHGLVEKRRVVTGIESLTHVEITEGLSVGERIIVPQGRELAAGMAVTAQ